MSALRSTHPGGLSPGPEAGDPRGPGAPGKGGHCLRCTLGPIRIDTQGPLPLPQDPRSLGGALVLPPSCAPGTPGASALILLAQVGPWVAWTRVSLYMCTYRISPATPSLTLFLNWTCHHPSLIYAPPVRFWGLGRFTSGLPTYPWSWEAGHGPDLSEVFVLAASRGSQPKTPSFKGQSLECPDLFLHSLPPQAGAPESNQIGVSHTELAWCLLASFLPREVQGSVSGNYSSAPFSVCPQLQVFLSLEWPSWVG